jgi:salicylate 5-hydroxylase small subunit
VIDAATRFAISDLYADYASALDQRRYDDWLELFAEDCRYVAQPRENHEAGLPLAVIRLLSKAMMRDRIHGATDTLYHAPYYQRHIIGPPRLSAEADGFAVEANFLVIRTHSDQPSDILSAGRYLDRITIQEGRALFADKLCVYDTELIPNSLIYPI